MTELDRTKVTFEQAEGLEPLPTQLKPRELTKALRNDFWTILHWYLSDAVHSFSETIEDPWRTLLHGYHTRKLVLPTDEFDPSVRKQMELVKRTLMEGTYGKVFGMLEYFLRHRECPVGLATGVEKALRLNRAGYRLVDAKTFFPITSEEDAKVAEKAFAALNASGVYSGARKHLITAGEHLTAGDWPGGVRESIQAVESVVRVLTGKKTFSEAIATLEGRWSIHGALKTAFRNLYGYTSDEPGIRHPLLDDPKPAVDEADALFTFGACAAFVTYLINKAARG